MNQSLNATEANKCGSRVQANLALLPHIYIIPTLFIRASIFLPGADVDVVEGHRAEGADEGRGQAAVGDEGHVEVDGGAANLVAVGELVGGEILGMLTTMSIS